MENPPIEPSDSRKSVEIFQIPTSEEMAFFDAPSGFAA
jgi:hypothetical protein